MMKKSYRFLLFATLATLFMFVAATVTPAQQHEHQNVLKVGKKGEMTLDKETMVGDAMLKPGRYTFQHRVAGEDHFVHFMQVTRANAGSNVGGGAAVAHPGEVKCRLETLPAKASQTEITTMTEGGTTRIVKIVVAGENVAHVF